jgi:xylan 1,4-beta-xylosidase
VMVWNYSDVAGAGPGAPTVVTIHGIPATVHRVLLEHYRLDETHSNAYTVWQSMGSPQQPTTEQFAELQAAGHLQLLMSPVWMDVRDGSVVVTTEIPRQGISLLHFSW